jgi:Xaa-Pro aminopeptidase
MKYPPIDYKLFIQNRANLASKLKPNSIAIFNSNDIMPTNADGTMLFRQNNDLFYMSGIDQEETVLVLMPDAPKPEWKEVLFIKETSEHIKIWEGCKLTKEQARDISGIQTIYWLSALDEVLPQMIYQSEIIYLNTNEHDRSSNQVPTRDDRFIAHIKNKYPLHTLARLAPLLHQLRAVKSEIELQLIHTAINITHKAFERVLKFVKPEVLEYQIEAEITHEFLWNGATRHAYTPIIASGSNACILHYNDNNKICKEGDLLLLDFGAEYANYAADLTRTIPVSGKFSERQKEVYTAVLNIQKFAKNILKPGIYLDEYHKEVGKFAEKELINLGLLNAKDVAEQSPEKPLYKKYFMHGTSHYLGLDVHDVGNKYIPTEVGMVFTVEPGIYIPDENIGIRLENNVVLTKYGNHDLMQNIPIEIEDIESAMANV